MDIHHYVSASGRDIYQEWIDKLKDVRARVAVQRRIDRIIAGNFGDHKPCREGVWELRIDIGAGYRVYYAQAEKMIVLLLYVAARNARRTLTLIGP